MCEAGGSGCLLWVGGGLLPDLMFTGTSMSTRMHEQTHSPTQSDLSLKVKLEETGEDRKRDN